MDPKRRRSLRFLHAAAPFSSTVEIRANPWRHRVIDANGLALVHVYAPPPAAIAVSDQRLTDAEAEKIPRLMVRLSSTAIYPRLLRPEPSEGF
jgi:hypothetical protein